MSETINTKYTSRYSDDDLKIAGNNQIGANFDGMTAVVQMHIYDSDNNYIESNYSYTGGILRKSPTLGGMEYDVDVVKALTDAGYTNGTYIVKFNFLQKYIPVTDAKYSNVRWFVQEISTSRTEVRIGISGEDVVSVVVDAPAFNETASNLATMTDKNVVLDFGEGNLYLAINQIISGESLVYKMYTPMPDTVNEKLEIYPFVEVCDAVVSTVILETPLAQEQPINFLRGPNTDIQLSKAHEVGTPYESWTDLVGNDSAMSSNIVNHFLSSSNWESTINVDYASYSNFIFFGSAEERVKNFKYKMTLLESYSSSIAQLTNSSASTSNPVLTSVEHFQLLQNTVLNNLDGYEKWLYYESGSMYVSGLGFGEVTESTWPKVTSNGPFLMDTQAKTTSVLGNSWYLNEITRAQDYDRENQNRLTNSLPVYLQGDVESESFVLFVNMIGQFFDMLWLYIKHFNQKYDAQHDLFQGAGKDIVWSVLKTFGLDLTNGNDTQSLWKYAFGQESDGTYGNNVFQLSSENATKEIWTRLLNNLPYLLKTKGTERGIRALITCYGIPSSILKIREYGGPDPDNNSQNTNTVQDMFAYSLNLDGTSQVSASWQNFGGSRKPDAIEFRFKNAGKVTDATIFEVRGVSGSFVNVRVNPSSSLYSDGGVVKVTLSSGGYTSSIATPELPLYNGDYWSLLMNRTYQNAGTDNVSVTVSHATNGRITHTSRNDIYLYDNTHAWESGSIFLIGSGSKSYPNSIRGSIQEFRLWRNVINLSIFTNHVLAPSAYNGNAPGLSMTELLLRWNFDQVMFYQSGIFNTLIKDVNPSLTFVNHGMWRGTSTASAFTAERETSTFIAPNVGTRRVVSDKVRIDSDVTTDGDLNRFRSIRRSKLDMAPRDSNRVGVFISPQDIINQDIMRDFCDIVIDDYIGDPKKDYQERYPDLIALNNLYWNKYTVNPNAYEIFKVFNYFDKSLFEQVKKMLPARTDMVVGFVIEQHYLERPKVMMVRDQFDIDLLNLSQTIDIAKYNKVTSGITPINAKLMLSGTLKPKGDSETIIPNNSLDLRLLKTRASSINIDSPATMSLKFKTTGLPEDIFVTQSLKMPWSTINKYSVGTLQYSSSVSNNTLTLISSSLIWDVTSSQILPVDDYWLDPTSYRPLTGSNGAVVGYSSTHRRFHGNYATGLKNLFYAGCKNTIYTTIDKRLPVEIVEDTRNTMVVVGGTDTKPRLKVE